MILQNVLKLVQKLLKILLLKQLILHKKLHNFFYDILEIPINRAFKMKKNHRYNLIPLCSKHHRLVHEGKIAIHGFVMGEDGLRLSYWEA